MDIGTLALVAFGILVACTILSGIIGVPPGGGVASHFVTHAVVILVLVAFFALTKYDINKTALEKVDQATQQETSQQGGYS